LLSVSALTASGTVPFVLIDTLSVAGFAVVVVLMHVGGIGFMAVVLHQLQRLGVPIFRRRHIPWLNLIGMALIIEIWVALLLALHWRSLNFASDYLWFLAFFHATNAFTNAGFQMTGSDPAFDAMVQHAVSMSVVAVAMLLGALGLPFIVDVSTRRRTLPQTIVTAMVLTVLLGGSVAGYLLSPQWNIAHAADPMPTRFAQAVYSAIAQRTAGLMVFDTPHTLAPTAQLWLFLSMFVGSAPGAMGGGVSPITLAIVIAGMRARLAQENTVMLWGQRVAPILVRRAGWIAVAGVVVVLVVTALLVWWLGVEARTALYVAIASFATVEIPAHTVTTLPINAWYLLTGAMIWGRVGTFLLVVSIYGRVRPKRISSAKLWLA
jgi:Trk-type K+ transport system membrane component